MAIGLMIVGSQATGKTTLELNLRQHVLGSWLTDEKYSVGQGVCFIGRTGTRYGSGIKPLMLSGADSVDGGFNVLPLANWYVAHYTNRWSTRGGPAIMRLMKRMDKVHVIGLCSRRRSANIAKRRKTFGNRGHPPLLDAEEETDPFKWPELHPDIMWTWGPYDTGQIESGIPIAFGRAYYQATKLLEVEEPAPASLDVDIVQKGMDAWNTRDR